MRCSLVLTYSPAELFRTRIQASSKGPISVLKEIKNMVQNHGLSSLYRGMSTTIIRDSIFSGVYWYSVESFTLEFSKPNESITYTQLLSTSLIGGTLSGLVASIVTHPADVVKTLQQVDKRPASMLGTLSAILKSNGISGLFAGLGPRLLRIGPSCGIMIASKKFLTSV